MNNDQKKMLKALEAITADFITAKETLAADPSSENWAEKKTQARQLQAARKVWRQNRPPVPPDPAVFTASDAEAFLPDDQGGDTVRALALLTQLFAERGDTDDPATVLAEMRANVIEYR